MNLAKILTICFLLFLTQSLSAQKKEIKLSNRLTSSDSVSTSVVNKTTYTKVFESLSGLSFLETGRTIRTINSDFKSLKSNEKHMNKKWTLRKEALVNIFNNNPASLLSLIWPLFLIFFIIWFILQYKKVFIQKIKF